MMSTMESTDNELLDGADPVISSDNEDNSGKAGMEGESSNGPAVFPMARIKKIIKADEAVNLVSAEAVQLVSSATEMFVDFLVRRASEASQNEKRRTILYKDFSATIKQDQRLAFLKDLVPETINIQAALEAQKQRGVALQSEDGLNSTGMMGSSASSLSTPSKSTPNSAEGLGDDESNSNDNAHTNNQSPSQSRSSVTEFFAPRRPSSSASNEIVDISNE